MELNLITDLINGAQAPVATETGPETGLEGLFLQLSQPVTPPSPAATPAPVPASTLGDLLQNLIAVEDLSTESAAPLAPEPQTAAIESPEQELTSDEQSLAPEVPVFAPALAVPVPITAKVLPHEAEVGATGSSMERRAQPAPSKEAIFPAQGENEIATTSPLPMAEPAQIVAPPPLMDAAIMPPAPQNQTSVQHSPPAQTSETLVSSTARSPAEPAALPSRRGQPVASFAERFFTQDQRAEIPEPSTTKEVMSQQPTITPPARGIVTTQLPTVAEAMPVEPQRAEARPQPELREVAEPSTDPALAPNVAAVATIGTTDAAASEPAIPDSPAPTMSQPAQTADPMQAVLLEAMAKPPSAEAQAQPPSDALVATEATQAEPSEDQHEPSPEAELTAKIEQSSAPELQREPSFGREALQSLSFSNTKEPAAQIRAPITPTFGPELAQSVSQQVSTAIAAAPDRPVELTLSPEELGRVRLSMQSTDTAMVVTVQADRQDTLDLMRRHIDTLAKDFRELGFSDISFSFSQNPQQNPTPTKSEARPELPFSEVEPSVEPIRIALTPAQSGLDLRI